MKLLFLLLSLLTCGLAHSQGGAYLSLQDFKDGKLTDASDDVKTSGGGWLNIKIAGQKKAYKIKDLWGFRLVVDGVPTDYKVILGYARAIYSKGLIWVYASGQDYFEKQNGKLMFVRTSNSSGSAAFPIITKGPEGPIQPITSWKKLLAYLNPPKEYEDNVKKGLGGHSLLEALNYYNEFMESSADAPKLH